MKQIDEGIAPIRAVRHEISREFGHDVRKYLAYLRGLESATYAKQVEAYRKAHPSLKRGRSAGARPAAAAR